MLDFGSLVVRKFSTSCRILRGLHPLFCVDMLFPTGYVSARSRVGFAIRSYASKFNQAHKVHTPAFSCNTPPHGFARIPIPHPHPGTTPAPQRHTHIPG